MTRRGALAAALLAASALAPPPTAAQDTGWTILGFHVEYTILPDRTLDVVERIAVDFGTLQRHGIYRDVPVRYRRQVRAGLPVQAGRVSFDLDVAEVTDGRGNRRQVKLSREGSDVRIRIGDPDRYVTGRQTYVIHYTLSGGLGFFDEHDELYWQVTGTGWPVPILQARATVTLPAVAAQGRTSDPGWGAWCYAGWATSTSDVRCEAEVVRPGQYRFTSGRLEPGEGLTLVAAFPKGVIAPPTAVEKAADWLARWGPLGLPLLALAGMTGWWWRRGREPTAGSVVPLWEPPEGLRPGAAGTLVDQRADMDDVVATLLDLAVRGYVSIQETKPEGLFGGLDKTSFTARILKTIGLYDHDWRLVRERADDAELASFERRVLAGIFEGGASDRYMSDLHNDFYTHLPGIHDALYADLVRQRLFPKRPDKTRQAYRWVGLLAAAAGVGLGIWQGHVVLAVGLGLSGLVVLLFSGAMPAMTAKGAKLRREVQGLEEYIRRAEKTELEHFQSPERTLDLFERLLPYAVALDVTDIWVDRFADLLASAPSAGRSGALGWYAGDSGGFSSGGFQRGLAGFQTAATRTLGSSPGSSSGSGGGGSVGGGGGGGGGGSW